MNKIITSMVSKSSLNLTLFLCLSITYAQQKDQLYKIHTIAFYNLENFFDVKDDPKTFDQDWTPKGKYHWTVNKYKDKVSRMAELIATIGADITKGPPVILGIAEIENRYVLQDIINEPPLRIKDYGIAHIDSPDKRGIDVALLYQKALFLPKNISTHPLYLFKDQNPDKREYTRDQLLVSGYMDGELMHFIVNHWPSRRGGTLKSKHKREKAALLNKKIIDSLFSINPYAKIITMGDLNDNPSDKSVKKILGAKANKRNVSLKGLYNPLESIFKKGTGSLVWRDCWYLFDQIIFSRSFINHNYNTYQYYKSGVFNELRLTNKNGKYKGYPKRSFVNGMYQQGYSDHFPVFAYIIKQHTNPIE